MGVQKIKNFCSLLAVSIVSLQEVFGISSPDGKIHVNKTIDGLSISFSGQQVMIYECGEVSSVIDLGQSEIAYEMLSGKRRLCKNAFTDVDVFLVDGSRVDMRIYNDGVTWKSDEPSKIALAAPKHNWIQQWVQPYEEFFPLDRKIESGERWAFPALFEFSDNVFMLLTESNISKEGAASSMYSTDIPMTFDIKAEGPGENGWITAIIGTIDDVVESTLVTDNSDSCILSDTMWIEPGVASWVYWAYNHGSKDYEIVKKYIDMAIALNLPYVLIDAEWDEMQGEHGIVELLGYANANGIKPMIWYNSSVGWIDGAPGPKFRLNDPAKREQEFAWCEANGVKGVKIDFFSGDNNQNMRYMIDLLECAASHHLLVNFHGATLPRGWQRTYPNLISTEGVYGAEWYNNVPTFTNVAARHNATLPFTRNVVGSMDYTPCAFSDSQHPHITTHAHELALTTLFESGIQHIADCPESIFAQPVEVQKFISGLPAAWDESYLLGGYPGEYVVMARKKGDNYYIAGINGNDDDRTIEIDMSKLPSYIRGKKATLYADGDNTPWLIQQIDNIPKSIALKARGGFVIKID